MSRDTGMFNDGEDLDAVLDGMVEYANKHIEFADRSRHFVYVVNSEGKQAKARLSDLSHALAIYGRGFTYGMFGFDKL